MMWPCQIYGFYCVQELRHGDVGEKAVWSRTHLGQFLTLPFDQDIFRYDLAYVSNSSRPVT